MPSLGRGPAACTLTNSSICWVRHMESVFRSQVRTKYQKPNEILQGFGPEIVPLMRRPYPTVPDEAYEIGYREISRWVARRAEETGRFVWFYSIVFTQALECEVVNQSVNGINFVENCAVSCKYLKFVLKKGLKIMILGIIKPYICRITKFKSKSWAYNTFW